jgi:hypothetical protein
MHPRFPIADYIDKNILCQAYIHVELPEGTTRERLDEIKKHLEEFATSRGKFFVYPDVDVSVEFREGSLKAYISIAGFIVVAISGYGGLRGGIDYLHTDIKRLADSLVSESLFMAKSKHQNIVRTEARTGIIGSLKVLVDDMNNLEASSGQIPPDEAARRIRRIKDDAEVLLTNLRSEEDAKNIEDEISDFASKLPDRWPNPPDRRPDDSAIIAYNDCLLELRKNFQKDRFRKVYPPSPTE